MIWQNLYIDVYILDAFTTEILKIWSEINPNDNLTSTENLLSLPLWLNLLVRIGNRPIYYKLLYLKGIQKVRHLMKDTNNLLYFTEFKEHLDIKTNFLVYHGAGIEHKIDKECQPNPK